MTKRAKDLGLTRRLRQARSSEERADILEALPYEVGFGKPARHTRFSTCHQPSRRGRSKGSENFDTIVQEEGDAQIPVVENGKRRMMSKKRLAVRQIANGAARGDSKSAHQFIDLLRKNQPEPVQQAPVFDSRDLQTFGRLLAILEDSDADDDGKTGGAP